MGLTHFPHGVASFGVPVLGSGSAIPVSTGTYFFVSSGIGKAGFDGLTPETPLATIDQAINKCTASKGDVIIVMPGHAETIAATDGFDADVAGISIVGLGWGSLRPTLTFSATASQVNIGAANVSIKNIRFAAGISAVVAGVQIEGVADTTIENCEWYWGGTTTWDFVIGLELEAGAHRTIVNNCRFLQEPAVAGTAAAVQLTGRSDNVVVQFNEFMGDCSTACLNGITTLSQGLMFLGNIVHNTDASEPYLEVLTGTTGVIFNTVGLASGATIAANAVADAMAHIENYVVNTTGTIAIIKGAGGSPALDTD